MGQYEIAAIAGVVLDLISHVPNPLYSMMMPRLYGPNVMSLLSLQHQMITTVQTTLKLLVGITIAVWLGCQAKKERASMPIRALWGLFFSVFGAILDFILRNQKDSLIIYSV